MKSIKLLLFGVILVDFLGLNMTLTLLPSLIMPVKSMFVPLEWGAHTRLLVIGLLTAVFPLGQFFGAALWGKLSDSMGRKFALLLAIASTCLGFIISAVAVYINAWQVFLIGRLITGFSAGNVAIVLAYMADISEQGAKSSNYSLMQTAIGLGLLLGASFGGLLSDSSLVSWFNYLTPFIAFIIVIMLNFLLLYRLLPNQPKKMQINKKINPLQSLLYISEYFKMKSHRMLLVIWSLFIAGMTVFGLMFPPFLAIKFKLNASHIGLLLTFWGCIYTMSQFFIIKPINKYYSSHFLLRALMVLPGVIALSVMLYRELYQLYIAIFFYAICLGFVMPNLFTIISDSVSAEHQGKILGVVSSIQGLMTVMMTLSGGLLLAINYNFVALVGGGLMCAAWLVYRYAVNDDYRVDQRMHLAQSSMSMLAENE